MKEGDEVDYTKKPARGKVKTCPKCGRNGEFIPMEMKAGKRLMVTHKKTFMGIYWRVTDSCIMPA